MARRPIQSAATRPPRDARELHREWLQLVETDGPFLAVPVLRRVWPQGMPTTPASALASLRDARAAFEQVWEAWDLGRREAGDGRAESGDLPVVADYRTARDSWVEVVCREVFGWAESYTTDLSAPSLATIRAGVASPDQRVRVTPAGVVAHEGTVGALLLVVDPVDSLRTVLDDDWANSPIDRMEELLRTVDCPTGVVTDGRWWAVVSARPGAVAASGVVDALTWTEEAATRDAFVELLSLTRLVGGKPEDRLPALFQQSIAAAEEITEALGVQVRRAVELLVQAFSDSAVEARRQGRPDPLPDDRGQVYEGAVTVMMRVVFLLFAEERDLLPQGALFSAAYTMGGRLDELDQRARDAGAEVLDGTSETWHRLLATSEALYAGASFEDLRLPSYGGSLFDPTRFSFLSARNDRMTLSVTVSDRVMLEVLKALQVARLRAEPPRRISFRDIDVEQIGYIYEGLLGYTCVDVVGVTVGLLGKEGLEPELPLATLERLAVVHPEPAELAAAIAEEVKATQPAAKLPTAATFAKALAAGDTAEDAERALRAVTTDEALRNRLRPHLGAIRRDLRERPVVVEPGGQIVVETPSRASAGAHYTPRALAEEVVRYALEPLVFSPGPRETADRDQWRPISAERLLDLKVADIACGSGAFLVAAARYLAARLVEAWHRVGVVVGSAHDTEVTAVRKVVARCLYGADINGMAVEMCKLSLWLVSLDPKLPFSFVDDKVLHGNSLLGVTDLDQVRSLHLKPDDAEDALFGAWGGSGELLHLDVDRVVSEAESLRRMLASEVAEHDPQQSLAAKRRQWDRYLDLVAEVRDVADGVIAAGLALGGSPAAGSTRPTTTCRWPSPPPTPGPRVVEQRAPATFRVVEQRASASVIETTTAPSSTRSSPPASRRRPTPTTPAGNRCTGRSWSPT